MSASLPKLPYADLPARWGVSIDESPSTFRIVVQPTFGWGSVFVAYQKAAIVFFVLLALSLLMVVMQARLEWAAVGANVLVYGMPIVIIGAVVHARARRRIVLEVTSDRVSYATLWPSGRGETTSWPRDRVGYAKLNPYNGQMTLQLIGEDLLQIWVSPNREVTEFVANKLEAALRMVGREPNSAGGGGGGSSISGDATLPPLVAPARSLPRWVLFTMSALMAGGGVVIIATDTAIVPLGFYLVLFSFAPIGIAFGTQPKKFWA